MHCKSSQLKNMLCITFSFGTMSVFDFRFYQELRVYKIDSKARLIPQYVHMRGSRKGARSAWLHKPRSVTVLRLVFPLLREEKC